MTSTNYLHMWVSWFTVASDHSVKLPQQWKFDNSRWQQISINVPYLGQKTLWSRNCNRKRDAAAYNPSTWVFSLVILIIIKAIMAFEPTTLGSWVRLAYCQWGFDEPWKLDLIEQGACVYNLYRTQDCDCCLNPRTCNNSVSWNFSVSASNPGHAARTVAKRRPDHLVGRSTLRRRTVRRRHRRSRHLGCDESDKKWTALINQFTKITILFFVRWKVIFFSYFVKLDPVVVATDDQLLLC